MTSLTDKLRIFLEENNADALLVNSTNEFLVEYNQLENNSRYILTGFSGSTGEALVTKEKIYLFIDGRYHEQADLEVDHDLVNVIKLQIGTSYIKELLNCLKQDSKLLVVASKISNTFLSAISKEMDDKNIEIMPINFDPVFNFSCKKETSKPQKIINVPAEISGLTADEKFEDLIKDIGKNEVLIITSLEDVAYFSNIRSFSIPYSSSFYGKLIITHNGGTLYSDNDISYIGNFYEIELLEQFEADLRKISNKTVLIDKKSITAKDYSLINNSNRIKESSHSQIKTIKNEFEINHFKESFRRADEALLVVQNMLQSNKIYSELDIYKELEKSFYEKGAKSLSFKPIVAAGKNSSIIHYSNPQNTVFVNEGDFLLVDCGGYYEGGYATDITRTFIKGTPSDLHKKVYTTVLKAFLNAFNHTYINGSTWFDIDGIARNTINESGLDDFSFNHSTGHGVGISVHESPPFVASAEISKTPIYKNAVFTIEPGIYKPAWGGVRLENTVFIKDINDNVTIETLSKFKFDMNIVDFSLLNKEEKSWLEEWQEL